MAQNFKIITEFDGTGLSGWQIQKDQYTVQEAIQNAIFKVTGEQVEVTGAGRTDAGVHALGMAANFTINYAITARKLLPAINHHLFTDTRLPYPSQIIIKDVEAVEDNFSARFNAKQRSYIYRIFAHNNPSILCTNRAWHIPKKLDIKLMHEAAQTLLGQHDFTSFRDSKCQASSPIKTIDKIDVFEEEIMGNKEIHMKIEAKSFLHHMVRNIIGTLEQVGCQKITQTQFVDILNAKDRTKAGVTAPAMGLYFYNVKYSS